MYRELCGPLYRAYSLAAHDKLAELRSALLAKTYQPEHATKLFFPKKSGIQRRYALLTVDDQIVYQAFANIIAERLVPRVKPRYNRSVFGHLYAGKSSSYFYRNWRDSYRRFAQAMRMAHQQGFVYTASFDLTACYDSIDHAVLGHFLRKLSLPPEFVAYLCELLARWTETSGGPIRIYHGHGIPQGPLPSGLLAEVLLSYFDEADGRRSIRYLRYVDDIRLFAKSEKELRRELIALDVRSNQIGLFPQSAKIDIHRVRDIRDEFKNISMPGLGTSATFGTPNQTQVVRGLVALSPRFNVTDTTKFKYLLGAADPSTPVILRLIEILRRSPALYEPIFRYVGKAARLSSKASREILLLLPEHDHYPAFAASLLRAVSANIHPSSNLAMRQYCRTRLKGPRSTRSPDLRAVAAAFLAKEGVLPWADIQSNATWSVSWWTRAMVIASIRESVVGRPSYGALLANAACDSVSDVALVAAELIIINRLPAPRPVRDMNRAARLALRRARVLSHAGPKSCEIEPIVRYVFGPAFGRRSWRSLFTPSTYKNLRTRFVVWRGYSETDPTAWVALTDTINDILLSELFAHDGGIGQYELGKIGAVLAPTSRLAKAYPLLFKACEVVHGLRLEADVAHAKVRTSGKGTRRIRFAELRGVKRVLARGYDELLSHW